MKTKVKQFTDELKLLVVQEYYETDVSQRELMRKYNIGGNSTIMKWMRKFDLQAPSQQQIEIQRTMAKQVEKSPKEQDLETKVQQLQQQLEHEKLRTLALNTMIDIAERDLKISIRKKSGAKQ
jgi:transposase-like protein